MFEDQKQGMEEVLCALGSQVAWNGLTERALWITGNVGICQSVFEDGMDQDSEPLAFELGLGQHDIGKQVVYRKKLIRFCQRFGTVRFVGTTGGQMDSLAFHVASTPLFVKKREAEL
jgi:hypothetical protein